MIALTDLRDHWRQRQHYAMAKRLRKQAPGAAHQRISPRRSDRGRCIGRERQLGGPFGITEVACHKPVFEHAFER